MHVPTGLSLEAWIRSLEREGKLYRFYQTPAWRHLRAQVLADYNNECKLCRDGGPDGGEAKYSRAVTVHHVQEVRKRPDLALSRWYTDPVTGEQVENLLPLCARCHNYVHGRTWEQRHANDKPKHLLNEERWD